MTSSRQRWTARRVLPLAGIVVAAVVVATLLAVGATRGAGGPVGGAPGSGTASSPGPDDPSQPAPGDPSGVPPAQDPASPAAPEPISWEQASTDFLDDYVDPDGRVVRRDQGGDTVSEGQAYAMLVAAALADRERFDLVWAWTQDQLERPEDGLLSWRWSEGAVVDAESASDADLDAARALLVAGDVFDDDALTTQGVTLGQAVLDHETVQVEQGRIMVAGTWALQAPYAYNPSYASPAATALLAEASGDERWAELDEGTRAITEATLADVDLPPDWAQVHEDGRVEPMPGAAGRGNEGVRYGYDATRLPLRFAESCEAEDVALAAELVQALDRFPGAPAVRDLGGQPLTEDESALAASAQAAAKAAAGDPAAAREELLRTNELEQRSPTYYGSAWNALSRLMLTTEELGGCAPLA